jgi:glycosyltransferase involved in cell wall biosynthesis
MDDRYDSDEPHTGEMNEERLLIISPVRNEAKHIERVVRAVASQTRKPDLWLVAENGSDDETLTVLRELEPQVAFMRVIEVSPTGTAARDRLALGIAAKAFNQALAQVNRAPFTHIGKLDGDIELPSDYFERVLERMRRNPELGICGGSILEPTKGGGWRRISPPSYHVHGALKLYTRQCFEAVGGIQERPAWDMIDETYARMRGFRTQRDPEIECRHHRLSGSADGNLRGRLRDGQYSYVARYSLAWVLARSLKVSVNQAPRGISGPAFVWGYLRCAVRRSERVEDDQFKRFVRQEHRRRVRRALTFWRPRTQ